MNRRRAIWAALTWAALIFIASVMKWPPSSVETGLPLDKVVHFILYLPLGGLVFLALGGTGTWGARAAAAAALLSGAYGLGLEGVQYFLPWRSFEWLDAGMDLLGAATGAAGVVAIGHGLKLTRNAPPA